MSIAYQIYYNAVFGGLGGLLGWLVVGSLDTTAWPIWVAYVFVGAGVGMCIGALTGVVDGLLIKRRLRPMLIGALTGALAGAGGGAVGLLLGEASFLLLGGGIVGRTAGWLLLGLLLGIGQGLIARSQKRAAYGAVGGAVAGVIGGLLYETMTQTFLNQSETAQMIVGGLGLILIGVCLGGIIPLTIATAARGSLRILSGPRANVTTVVLDSVTMGSYDGCHVYLPGDSGIAPKHARVYLHDNQFYVQDLGSQSGLQLNGKPLQSGQTSTLAKGTCLQLGKTMVEFQ